MLPITISALCHKVSNSLEYNNFVFVMMQLLSENMKKKIGEFKLSQLFIYMIYNNN